MRRAHATYEMLPLAAFVTVVLVLGTASGSFAQPAGHERQPHTGARPTMDLHALPQAVVAPSALLDSLSAPRPSSGELLDLLALLHEALLHNPQIAQARELWRGAQDRVPQAGALAEPVLGLALDEQPFDRGLPGMRVISLSQALPFPGKRARMTEIAQRESEASLEQARDTVRDVLAQVKVAYFELFRLESTLWTLRSSSAALRDVIEVNRARYETGIGAQQDLLLAQVERGQLDGEIAHTEALAHAARTRLNLVVGGPADQQRGRPWLDGPSPFSAALEEVTAAARESRPALRAQQREAAAADAGLRLARRAAAPDLMVAVGYMQLPGQPDMWRAELGLTLPAWKGRKQDFAVAEATRRAAAARARLRADTNQVIATVAEEYAHVTSEREIVDLYRREILPLAELAYASTRAGYLGGEGSFLAVLEAFRKRVELLRDYYGFLADAEIHLARLEAAVGRDLGRIEIFVDAALVSAPAPPGDLPDEGGNARPAGH